MAITGESITEPMRTGNEVISWDEILIVGAQLAKIHSTRVSSWIQRRSSDGAKVPLVTETPVFITYMSFGALSKEVKIAIAKESAAIKTPIGSGEVGFYGNLHPHDLRPLPGEKVP